MRATTLALDPFGFFPGAASAIRGLGGTAPPDTPDRAFHSPFVYASGGPLVFRLRFAGLSATDGVLRVRVNRLPARSTGWCEVVHDERIALPALAAAGGLVEIALEAADGDSYAILGNVDGGDAAADGLTLEVERRCDPDDQSRRLRAAREGIFGPAALARAGALVAHAPATLADPVSQLCTLAQLEEPACAEWMRRMDLAELRPHRKLWEFVYILQVLRRYGALREGMRGLGFGVGQERLPAVMAAAGCTVVATDLPADDARAGAWTGSTQHSDGLDALRFPAICPDSLLDRQVSFRPVDMAAIPRDLRGFDFAWSSCAFEHLGSIAAGLRFVERSLACVKPGGIVVHTTELNLTSDTDTVERGATVLFRRRDIETLARRLRRRGHWVAPIKYDPGDARLDDYVDVPPYLGDAQLKIALSGFVTTSFGLVVRRGPRRPLLSRLLG